MRRFFFRSIIFFPSFCLCFNANILLLFFFEVVTDKEEEKEETAAVVEKTLLSIFRFDVTAFAIKSAIRAVFECSLIKTRRRRQKTLVFFVILIFLFSIFLTQFTTIITTINGAVDTITATAVIKVGIDNYPSKACVDDKLELMLSLLREK